MGREIGKKTELWVGSGKSDTLYKLCTVGTTNYNLNPTIATSPANTCDNILKNIPIYLEKSVSGECLCDSENLAFAAVYKGVETGCVVNFELRFAEPDKSAACLSYVVVRTVAGIGYVSEANTQAPVSDYNTLSFTIVPAEGAEDWTDSLLTS